MRISVIVIIISLFVVSNVNASKSKDLRKIDRMYDDGLLTRSECVKAKKKYLEVTHLQLAKRHRQKKQIIKFLLLKEQPFL